MLPNRARRAVIACHPIGLVLWSAVAFAQGEEGEDGSKTPRVAVIVHPSNKLPKLAVKELEGIFLLERRHWVGDSKITPVVRGPGSDMYKVFGERVLKSHLPDLPGLYQERAARIRTVSSDKEAVAIVRRDKSAVAYVWEQAVTSKVRVIALLDFENPEDAVAPAKTARVMATLRGLWDQLASSLRNPRVPREDLQLIASAVAEESANLVQIAPKGKDEAVVQFLKMCEQLKTETAAMVEQVDDRAGVLRRMAKAERELCVECHRAYRQ